MLNTWTCQQGPVETNRLGLMQILPAKDVDWHLPSHQLVSCRGRQLNRRAFFDVFFQVNFEKENWKTHEVVV